MKICIFYFSGTGNTKKIVNFYVNCFNKLSCNVDVKNIDDFYNSEEIIDPNEYDKIGIAYPIHAFNAPSNVLKFAKRIKKQEEKKDLFIIKSSGEPLALNNISSLKLRSILKRRRIYLKNEYHYCMPYNIIFRHADSTAYKMWKYATEAIAYDCKQIVEGQPNKLPYFPLGKLIAWIMRIEHIGGRLNGRFYKVNDECNRCGKCIRNCPAHNITIGEGKIEFGKSCMMCMRCAFNCPKDAITIGLFNSWKVNGEYNFLPATDQEAHDKYCKRAYRKYYDRIEKKIIGDTNYKQN